MNMLGAAAEASALDAYYAAIECAAELVKRKLWDKGMEKWDSALIDVAPHISSEQLNRFKYDRDNFFQSKKEEKRISDDTDSDSDEKKDEAEDSDNDSSANLAMAKTLQDEYTKLTTRHSWNARKKTSHSTAISSLGRRRTLQVPHTSFRNDGDRSHTPRGHTGITPRPSGKPRIREPTASDEFMTVSEPTASPAVNEPIHSTLPEIEDQFAKRSTQPHPSSALSGLMSSKENNEWFDNLQSIAHEFVYGKKREFWPTQPVKVAILDSGFALTGEARKVMKPYLDRIKGTMSFTHEFPSPRSPIENQRALNDPVGHGTTVAYQLMKTCPSAHVYIAKVTVAESDQKKAVLDKAAVARAIRHAATPDAEGGWGVDVINMSFGWNYSELPQTAAAANRVSDAIEFADKKGVLLFAAASNYGLTQLNDVFYPARDRRVVSVDAEDGRGNPASFALHSIHGSGTVRYCAPGLSIDSPVAALPMCGSSFACPVAAGVAALVLEFARHKDVALSKSDSVQSALSSAVGMLKIFERMSQQAANRPGFRMLYPWHFFRDDSRDTVTREIIAQLQIEFGREEVGNEIEFTTTWRHARTTVPDAGVV